MTKIRIMIADDHPMIRQGIKQILELENDFDVVALACNGDEAVKLVKQHKPDVILMDINMPDTNGIEALQRLKEEEIPAKVLMLTIHDDREYLLELIKLGISGYVLKDIEPQGLIEAVRSASRGETYIQPNLTRALVAEYNRLTQPVSGHGVRKNLTVREKEVLAYIAEGMSNGEISNKLGISEKTVKNHVSSILRKLNLMDRTQVAVFAIRNKLV